MRRHEREARHHPVIWADTVLDISISGLKHRRRDRRITGFPGGNWKSARFSDLRSYRRRFLSGSIDMVTFSISILDSQALAKGVNEFTAVIPKASCQLLRSPICIKRTQMAKRKAGVEN
jgi:hypothetical protein